MGHLESNELAEDLSLARDFDLGMNGPPLFIAMDFIAGGLVLLVSGVLSAAVLFGFAWWAPLVLLGVWGATHRLLRESGVWKDRNTDEVRVGAPARGVRLRPGGRAARGQGAADVRARRLGDRAVHPAAHPAATSCSGRPPSCASGRWPAPCSSSSSATWLVFWALADAVARRTDRARCDDHLPAGRGRCSRGRLRRPELGAGHRRRARPRRPSGCRRRWRTPERSRRARAAAGRRRAPEIRFRGVTLRVRRRAGAAGPRPHDAGRHLDGGRRASTAPARPRWPSCCAGSTTRSRARSRSTASTCATSTSTSTAPG